MKKVILLVFITAAIISLASCGKCKHENTVKLDGKAASCTAEGLTEGEKCADCDTVIVEQQPIAKKAHNLKTIPAVEATCSEEGATEGKKCTICNQNIVPPTVIAKKAHTEVDKPYLAPTCTEDGSEGGSYCDECGEDIEPSTIIDATGHTEKIIAGYAKTCTADGLTDGKECDVCGVTLQKQEAIPASHDEVTLDAVPATCIAQGLTEGKSCSACGEVLTAQEATQINPNNHTNIIDVAEIAPTCTSIGYTAGKQCDDCKVYTEGHTEQAIIDHSPEVTKEAKDPDCGTETHGWTAEYSCSVCGEVTTASEVVEYKHAYSEWTTIIDPTETSAGERETHCPNCGSYITEEIPALGDKEQIPDIDDDGVV